MADLIQVHLGSGRLATRQLMVLGGRVDDLTHHNPGQCIKLIRWFDRANRAMKLYGGTTKEQRTYCKFHRTCILLDAQMRLGGFEMMRVLSSEKSFNASIPLQLFVFQFHWRLVIISKAILTSGTGSNPIIMSRDRERGRVRRGWGFHQRNRAQQGGSPPSSGEIEKATLALPTQSVGLCKELGSNSIGLSAQPGSKDVLVYGCRVEWLDEEVMPIGGVDAQCGVTSGVLLLEEDYPPSQPMKKQPLNVHSYAKTMEC